MTKKAKIIRRQIEGKQVKIVLKTISTADAKFKVVEEKADRWVIEGYASVFGNVDSYGEIVVRGAFAEWIAQYAGRYPKLVWAHDWSKPLGPTLEAIEDDYGLFVRGELLKDVQQAVEAHALITSGTVTDLSFGFSVMQDEFDPQAKVRKLLKIAIYEWSPVLVGANELATITGAKALEADIKADGDFIEEPEEKPAEEAEKVEPEKEEDAAHEDQGKVTPGADEKVGRTLSAKTRSRLNAASEAMKTAVDAIEALLAEADAEDDGKATAEPAKPEGTSPRDEQKVVKAIVRHARRVDQEIGKLLIKAKTIKG